MTNAVAVLGAVAEKMLSEQPHGAGVGSGVGPGVGPGVGDWVGLGEGLMVGGGPGVGRRDMAAAGDGAVIDSTTGSAAAAPAPRRVISARRDTRGDLAVDGHQPGLDQVGDGQGDDLVVDGGVDHVGHDRGQLVVAALAVAGLEHGGCDRVDGVGGVVGRVVHQQLVAGALHLETVDRRRNTLSGHRSLIP